MKAKLFLTIVSCLMMSALLFIGAPARGALADGNGTNFESYALGNINGQDGWTKSGGYDVAVVSNTYGYASFGAQSLRISDAVTSGSFGDQTFARPLINGVGETAATAGPYSVGTRQKHFEMQFDLASTLATLQTGLHVSVSPDRGDGSRMSYLRFEDRSDGIHVFFDDVTDPGPVGTVATFNDPDIATVTRAPHTIKMTMDMVDGPGNDVVKVYIDGVLKVTGTSWEDYYRYDPEAAAEQSPRIIKTVLFRAGGTAVPADAGKGFLVDNLSLASSVPADTTIVVTPSSPNTWFFYDDDFPGGIGNFVTGPATPPLGTGSVHLALPHNPNADANHQPRQAISTLAYAGTRLSQITNFQYSTYGNSVPGANDTIYLQFDVDYNATDGNTNYQGRLVYLPYTAGSIVANTWQTWSPMTQGIWYSSRLNAFPNGSGNQCGLPAGCTWSQVLSTFPNAGIMANNGGVHLKAGGPADGFDGNVDDFVIGVNNSNTTYNFESGSTALVFVPNNANVGVGGQTVIGIDLNNVVGVYGFEFQVSYDASKASATGVWADNATPQFQFFRTNPPATIPGGWNAQCASGTCKFAVSHTAPQTAVTGSGPLAFIVLTGVAPGTFTMNFSSDIVSDIDGGPIAHTTNTANITVYGFTTVSGTVLMQGRATPITSGTVTLTDLGGNFPPVTANFSALNGTYTFSNVPALPGGSSYQFDAAHSLYLGNRQTQTLTPGTPYTAPTTTLRGGDADNSGLIDISDLSCIGAAFGGSPTVCGATGSTDINADGTVNILDLVLTGGNYGLATPRPW